MKIPAIHKNETYRHAIRAHDPSLPKTNGSSRKENKKSNVAAMAEPTHQRHQAWMRKASIAVRYIEKPKATVALSSSTVASPRERAKRGCRPASARTRMSR